MKKILLTLANTLLLTTIAFAQKPTVAAAEAALNKGELAEAKEMIDGTIAAELEKIKEKNDKLRAKGKDDKVMPLEIDDAKTLYTKGTIYQKIATSDNEAYRNLSENAIEEAIDAYNKVLALDNAFYTTFTDQNLQQFYGEVFNKAIEYYNNDDMEGAMEYFEKAYMVNNKDTSSIVNAFITAFASEKDDKAAEIGAKIMEKGIGNMDFFKRYAQFQFQKENYDEVLKAIDQARKLEDATPEDNQFLMSLEINTYQKTGKEKEAIAALEKAIEEKPDDKQLHFNLAVFYDNSGEKKKAMGSYQKAAELDSDFYEAQFNLGVLYYNEGQEIAKALNNLEADKQGRYLDQEKAKSMQDEMKGHFEEALPFFERAVELKPDQVSNWELLGFIYNTLKMKDKFEEAQKKIEALEE